MGSPSSPSLATPEVPPHLAAVARSEFPWHRTPALPSTDRSMRDLCDAAIEGLVSDERFRPPRPEVATAHKAVIAETVYTLLKHGSLVLAGKRDADSPAREVDGRLERMLKEKGAVVLDDKHPYEKDAGLVRKEVRNVFAVGRPKGKPQNVLNAKPGFEQAVAWLRSDGLLRRFVEERMPELLRPSNATIRSLPRELLRVLDDPSISDEPSRRQALVRAITEYCDLRDPNPGPRFEAMIEKYRLAEPGNPDEDELVWLFTNIQRRSLQSFEAEKELRPLLMTAVIALANEPPPEVRMGPGTVATAADTMRLLVTQIWPDILSRHNIPATACGEAAIAALAVSSRIDPLEDVRAASIRLEPQNGR